MSNHSGGYMLNKVLWMLDEEFRFFEGKTKGEIRNVFEKFTEIGAGYDTNDGEVLQDICDKYSICYCCMKESDDIERGLCYWCREQFYYEFKVENDDIEILEYIPNDRRKDKLIGVRVRHKETGIVTENNDEYEISSNVREAICKIKKELAMQKYGKPTNK